MAKYCAPSLRSPRRGIKGRVDVLLPESFCEKPDDIWRVLRPPPRRRMELDPTWQCWILRRIFTAGIGGGGRSRSGSTSSLHRRADGLELAGQQLPRRPTHFARRRTPPLSLPSSRINQECGHKDPSIGRFLAADGARDKEETLEGGNRHLFIHYPATTSIAMA